ncbi:fimbrial protein [Scandinavium sp. TWS1a]|uniref:fimbrial protein n=1 Tax=Scandinavium tedordense TaxID=2926521 RepID=UPI00135B05EB|nr:fimbrial protein [Scandinavium tedordense]MCS2171956.1 fimbrial protein [Scandinavium tedordense]
MKNNVIAMAIAATAVLSAANSFATSGQVNFTGEIIDAGCDVINTVSNPLQVNLGQVAKSEFVNAGDTAAVTGFNIQLTNCPISVSTASIKFDGAALNGDNSVLALTQGVGVATGVGIQISDQSGVLPLAQQSMAYSLQSGSTMNNLPFTARYKSVAATVTAGPANSVANFSVIYN